MLAMEMKASGMYVSRGLSFRQAEVIKFFDFLVVDFNFVPKLPLDNVYNITSQVTQCQANNVPTPSACFIILIELIDFVVWETTIYSILHKISIINNNSLKRSQPYCYCVLLQFCNVEASLTASQIKVYDTAVHVWYAF